MVGDGGGHTDRQEDVSRCVRRDEEESWEEEGRDRNQTRMDGDKWCLEGRVRKLERGGPLQARRTNRTDLPDAVDILDGITDLLPQLLLFKLHLRHSEGGLVKKMWG